VKKIIFLVLMCFTFVEEINAEINDKLFMIVGDRAITQSDIVNEIKILLILNNESYTDEIRDKLQQIAVTSIIKRTIKEIEVKKNNYFAYNEKDLDKELLRLAQNINVDVDTLKNICASNELSFSLIENNIKVDLMWNSIIFQLYKDKLTINKDEIDESLKLKRNKKEIYEYLISEILIENNDGGINLDLKEKKLKEKIKNEGFETVAKNSSISESALKGGDLGWVNENSIAKKIKPSIVETLIGGLSKPIILSDGILFFKVRDKRKVEKKLTLEEEKNELVNLEKVKILRMHSLTHYDKLKRTIAIKFLQ